VKLKLSSVNVDINNIDITVEWFKTLKDFFDARAPLSLSAALYG